MGPSLKGAEDIPYLHWLTHTHTHTHTHNTHTELKLSLLLMSVGRDPVVCPGWVFVKVVRPQTFV